MPDLWMDVDTALSEVPVNLLPLLDDGDFKSKEEGVAYNAAGMDLVWNFTTTAGATTQTAVTPTTGGDYDWAHQGNGMYTIEIPASAGASINNDTEGFGWFTGVATGILPWRGPVIGFRAAALNNALIDGGDSLDVNATEISGDSGAADNAEAFFDGTGYAGGTIKLGVDAVALSGDSAAADNAEAMFDGTGYAGGTIKLGVNLIQILGTTLTETAGQIAAAFKKFFDVATPTGTVDSLPDAAPGANGGLPTTNGSKLNQTADLTAGSIVSGSFGAGAIDAAAIANGAIDAATFAAGAIDAAAIANGAIDAATFAAGAIDAAAIATGAIDADAIADNAIDAGAIATGAIDADAIAASAITNAKFALGAITEDVIAANSITSSELAASAIEAIADQVWNELIAGHLGAGSTGAQLNAAGGAGITAQDVRDAMKLAPTAGAPAAGSIDAHLDTVETNVGTAVALDGGVASLAGMLTKVADNNGGADFVAANDSLHEVAVDTSDVALRIGTAMTPDGGVYKFTANALEDGIAPMVDAVWDELIAGHLGAGSTGAALNGASAPSAATVADAVWDEALAGHAGAGSAGAALSGASAPSAAVVADAVWDEGIAGHAGAGSTGAALAAVVPGVATTLNAEITEIHTS